MRNLTFVWMTISALFILACTPKPNEKTKIDQKKPNQIEILDFYGTHRCTACISIEEKTRYTLETYFSDWLKNKTIVFKTVKFDEPANEKLVERFEAYGTSLFINIIKDGKETHIDLSNFAFQKEHNKAVFVEELKTKIEKALQQL